MENLIIKKLNKNYGKRKIKVYQNKKLYGEISEWFHWICIDPIIKERSGEYFNEKMKILRKIAMENLWWLLHSDSEEEIWKETCDKWNEGHIIGTTGKESAFFPGEYEIALNSINNI